MYQENERDIIGQYIIFCKVYREQRKCYGNTREAVTETIRICKNKNVLKDFLESREQEVVDIMMTLFDDEQILKAYAKDIEDHTAKETEKRTAKETAVRMIKKGKMTLEEIAECVPSLRLEELKKLESEIMQMT